MFEKFIVKKSGFSIAEALIAMLIIAMVAMLSAPIITKKKKVLESNAIHGKWVCYYDKNIGKYKYGTAADIDSDVKKWKNADECKFPVLSPNVKFLWVEVFGAGGGGSRGWAKPWTDKYRTYKFGEAVENDGKYEISFTPKFNDYNVVQPIWDPDLSDENKSSYIYQVSLTSELYTKFCPEPADGKHGNFKKDHTDTAENSVGKCFSYSYNGGNDVDAGGCSVSGTTTCKDDDIECLKKQAQSDASYGCLFFMLKKGRGTVKDGCTADADITCTDGKNSADGSTCTCPEKDATTCTLRKKGDKYDCVLDDKSYFWYEEINNNDADYVVTDTELAKKYTYCGKRSKPQNIYSISKSSLPPREHNSKDDLLDYCNTYAEGDYKDGLKDCHWDGNEVFHNTYTYTCKDRCTRNSLGYASFTSQNNSSLLKGVRGTLQLKPNETVYWKVTKEGDIKTRSQLQDSGGYPLKSQDIKLLNKEVKKGYAKDGDTIILYHRKNLDNGGGNWEVKDIPIATFKGPSSGKLGTKDGDACCNCCGGLAEYPRTKIYNSTQCAVYKSEVEVTINPAYSGQFSTISADGDYFKVLEQTFVSGYGCYGENGGSASSLMPASKGSSYKFYAGKGGFGAEGPEDNTVTSSATEGETSYFGWVSVPGGGAAGDNCRNDVKPSRDASSRNVYYSSLGLGGAPGGVTKHQNPPKRDYTKSVEEDIAPHEPDKRWTVQDGGDGTGGMIVVSW